MSALATQLVSELTPLLSAQAQLLVSPDDVEFKTSNQAWSDINAKVPAAVLRPATYDDVAAFVKYATARSIPFVARSGGHSIHSSIGPDGVLIDMRLLDKIEVDKERKTVTFQSGVLAKPLAKACWEEGFFVTTGNCNEVGAIPVVLGGGFTVLQSRLGAVCDSLVECKTVLASGEIVTISETSHPDLFWGIRGAGMYYGITLECTLKIHPFADVGKGGGQFWTAMLVLDVNSQEPAVLSAFEKLLQNEDPDIAGMILMGSPPPAFQPALIAVILYNGPTVEAEKVYSEILSLPHLFKQVGETPFHQIGDPFAAFNAKGGYKCLDGVGIQSLNLDTVRESFKHYRDFVAANPDAVNSAVALEFAGKPLLKAPDTAFRHREGVRFWAQLVPWWTKESTTTAATAFWDDQLALFRRDQTEVFAYNNFGRRDNVEWRYPGGVLERLRTLKAKYDPNGAFTKEFLA